MHSSASPWQRWASPSLLLNGQNQGEVIAGTLPGSGCVKNFKLFLIMFHKTSTADLLIFCQLSQDHTPTICRWPPPSLWNWKRLQRGPWEITIGATDLSYRMSAKKTQLCTLEAVCLWYQLTAVAMGAFPSRIVAILLIPAPKTNRQVWEFLGIVLYYQLWIPVFA